MKTVVVVGNTPLPAELRALIERGSTSLVERHVAEISGTPAIEADRLVFWSAAPDPDLDAVARRYAAQGRADGGETVMFVSGEAVAAGLPFAPDELFVWPGDEDRLKMAFLTGA